MEIPGWLDETFLTTALQGSENDSSVVVERFDVKPGTATGDNYTSYLFKVGVDYTVGPSASHVSLVVKVPSYKGMFKELSEKYDLFGAEPLVYKEIIPKVKDRINAELAPKSFKCTVKNGLVLQDLNSDGYVMHDRFDWLEFSHCKLVIEALAKFHAGSIYCFNSDPDLVKRIGGDKFFVGERMKPWAESSFRACAKTLMEVGGHERFANLLLSKADGIWESVLELCGPKPDCLNVLNHGDTWINNILFKYDSSGTLTDLRLIDFQFVRYGPPVLDIVFFIWTSVSEEVRENNLQEIYESYIQTLNKTLEECGCTERMSLQSLQDSLRDYTDWILMMVCFINSFTMREPEEFIDVGSLTKDQLKAIGSDNKFISVFNNKHYKPLLPGIARQLDRFLFSQESSS